MADGRLRPEMSVSPDKERWVPAEPGFEEAFAGDAPPRRVDPSAYPYRW
jgi:hypothetical protein